MIPIELSSSSSSRVRSAYPTLKNSFELSYLEKMDAAVLAFFQQTPTYWYARRHIVAGLPAYTIWQLKRSLQRLHQQAELEWRKKRWRLAQGPTHPPKKTPEKTPGVIQEDLDWVRYWQQHRAERLERNEKERARA